jgi:preprotein translocase subunit SecA
VFEPAPEAFEPPPMPAEFMRAEEPRRTKRFNALGILEDIPTDARLGVSGDAFHDADIVDADQDDGAAPRVVAQGTPQVVGAGAVRSLAEAGGAALPAGWEQTPRNNVCPCGSGKKFKKCHGAHL